MRGLGAMEEIGLADRVRYVGPCVIEGRLFDLGAYPGLRFGSGRVIGEIHEVLDPDALVALDQFEGFEPAAPHDSLYLRERVPLLIPKAVMAWLYVYNREPEETRWIEGGDWRIHLERRTQG
jgi:gamma-glutamylcyclotransferase (GGCT)/AIG2-like uncharacterized protein YtfP